MKHAIKTKKQMAVEELNAKCLKKRGVRSCKQCCRYQECLNNQMPEWRFDNLITLSNEIVVEIGKSYCLYYKNGCKRLYNHYKSILQSNFITILTANQTDGYALEEQLHNYCVKYYGDFDEICKKRLAKYKHDIDELKELLKQTKNISKRAEIRNKIYKLQGEMYE